MAKERTDKKPLPHSNVFVNRMLRLASNSFPFGPATSSLEGVCGACGAEAEVHFLPLQKTQGSSSEQSFRPKEFSGS